MHIGSKVKELLNKKNVSVIELASKTGMHRQTIYDILEKAHFSTEILEKFSIALEVPIAYFIIDDFEELVLVKRKKWRRTSKEIDALKAEIEKLKEKIGDKESIIQSHDLVNSNNEKTIEELKRVLEIYEKINKRFQTSDDQGLP